MQKEPLNVLAINPGTRYIGIALFFGTELRDWGVRVSRGKRMKEIIVAYLHRYRINVIALKKLHLSRTSRALRATTASVKRVAAQRRLTVSEYSIEEVKEALLPDVRMNKRLLMEEVALRYPFLLTELQREEKHKNPYLIRMFEAVGIGAVCVNQHDVGQQKVEKSVK